MTALEEELHSLNHLRWQAENRLREIEAREQRAKARRERSQPQPTFVSKRTRDPEPEAEPEQSKRLKTVPSLVVARADPARRTTPAAAPIRVLERPDAKLRPTLTPDEAKRSKRVFGALLGTLKRFKADLSTSTDAARRREEAERKAEEKVIHEHDAYAEQLQSRLQEEKTKELVRRAELDQLRDQKDLQLLEVRWQLHEAQLSHWFKTEAQPPIFYRPRGTLKADRVLAESTAAPASNDVVAHTESSLLPSVAEDVFSEAKPIEPSIQQPPTSAEGEDDVSNSL